MRDFKTLSVWQKAHRLTLNVYKVSTSFPKGEIYGLTSQMRRASVSVASNIAEGCGRGSDAEMAHFMSIATGSASELQCQILLAGDLGFLDGSTSVDLEAQVIELKKMISSFIKRLKTDR